MKYRENSTYWVIGDMASEAKAYSLPYPPPWQDTTTLARHLSVSPGTVDNWVAQGILPAPRRRGGKLLWKWSEVDERLTMGEADEPDTQAERIKNATRAAASQGPVRY